MRAPADLVVKTVYPLVTGTSEHWLFTQEVTVSTVMDSIWAAEVVPAGWMVEVD